MCGRLIVLSIFLLVAFGTLTPCAAQPPESDSRKPRNEEEMPKNIRETLAKQRIARDKREYDDLLKRAEDAVKLSEELEKTFVDSRPVTTEELKKLEKLEKLVRKIRSDLGGSDDEESEVPKADDNKPASLAEAFRSLQSSSLKLFDELKKSTRYSVSVVAIQSSNFILRVLRFIRIGN
jgi:hypothetical protein